MTVATEPMIGAGAASTQSPTVVNAAVVWHERPPRRTAATTRKQSARKVPSLTAKNYAKLQQLAVANTRELTGRDRF